ncbi:hypothetical protein [Streptomyces sp. NPDC006285]|uniref:hypothetical protein n=1 Tax=Streptomyces sp. NPDC006285 TaxID=3364742 RepID=UPI0036A2CBE4
MRTFSEAATGFPSLLFTAALIVVLGFWLLVACGAVRADSFDSDADLGAWGLGGVPVAVALSVLTAFAWLLSLSAVVLLDAAVPADVVVGLAKLAVPAAAPVAAWHMTRLFVRPLHRLFPDEPGASQTDGGLLVGGVAASCTHGTAAGRVLRNAPCPATSTAAARDHAV